MKTFRTFQEARAYVRDLKLRSTLAWYTYSSSGLRPHDIPSNPNLAYKGKGWIDFTDWVGGECRNNHAIARGFLPYTEAKTYVRELHLSSQLDFMRWRASGHRPVTIPSNPAKTYRGKGWTNWNDWLGTDNRASDQIAAEFLPFEEARTFMHAQKLQSQKEFRSWEERTSTIPSNPHRFYAKRGWRGFADFLGYDDRLSYGERIIRSVLDTQGALYRWQATVKGCVYKGTLRFDFGIYTADGNLAALVEYHGEQHDRPVKWFGGEEKYLDLVAKDQHKVAFCLERGIPLHVLRGDNKAAIEAATITVLSPSSNV